MHKPEILLGTPLNFQNKILIYPPTVKEVVTNSNFGAYYKILTMTSDDIKDELREKISPQDPMPTPFEYLALHYFYVPGFSQLFQQAIKFFCKIDVAFSNNGEFVYLVEDVNDENIEEYDQILTEDTFFDFQNLIREACGDKPIQPPEPEDPDEDPRITEIKRRARERDKIKARHERKNGISFATCLTAICCMGIGLTPLNIGEMSYASVGFLMKMMQEKEKYNIDIKSLLAGADSKKIKPKYWIRNSDKE